ncbi:MAG: helix-turn-helix transcriptional regulator [Paracoccaceae bacterium]
MICSEGLKTRVRDYLSELTNADSVEMLWDLHTRKMAEYGFDRLLYGFTYYRSGNSFGDPADFVILTNHPKDYTDVYIGESLFFDAPMVRWALEHEGACSWNVVNEMVSTGNLGASERRVLEFNRRMGVTAGYSISFKAVTRRSKGAIALTARPGLDQAAVDALWERHGPDILLMNNIAHLKILTLPHSGAGRSLTRRQLEVLRWVGDGKTTQDIATIMGLTPATVEKHLRLARAALDVQTTAQAVLKAAFQNQMFIVER